MEDPGFKKSEAFKVVDILEYLPNSIVIKSILRKTTGNISAVSFDAGEVFTGKISPFDAFLLIIDGNAEIIIDDISHLLVQGQSIIIPAHSRSMLKANIRFKMLSAVIKNGYEELSL